MLQVPQVMLPHPGTHVPSAPFSDGCDILQRRRYCGQVGLHTLRPLFYVAQIIVAAVEPLDELEPLRGLLGEARGLDVQLLRLRLHLLLVAVDLGHAAVHGRQKPPLHLYHRLEGLPFGGVWGGEGGVMTGEHMGVLGRACVNERRSSSDTHVI